jgi:putative two-component system response regulator
VREILVVGEGEPIRLLEVVLREQEWRGIWFPATFGVLRQLRSQSDIDLVILCPSSAFEPFTELCRQVKFDTRTALLPVIFILAPAGAFSHAEIFAAGADDCINLPTANAEIVARVRRAVRTKRATDSLEDATAVITSLAIAIEGRDRTTRGHVDRVSAYSVRLGRKFGFREDQLVSVRVGGVVHDIGKVAIPDQILSKPGKLTAEEMALVRQHPVIGYDILKPTRAFQDVLPIVRWHHERPNGTGYPDGLKGDAIPLVARIVAVADVFDALSTARPYHPAYPLAKCRGILLEAAHANDLDADVVFALLDTIESAQARFSSSVA